LVSAALVATPGVALGQGCATTFQSVSAIAQSGQPDFVAAGDLNGDGKADLVSAAVAPPSTLVVRRMLGNGDGTFSPPVAVSFAGTTLTGVACAPINSGDLRSDVVALRLEGVEVLIASADGSLAAPISTAAGFSAVGLAVGLVDGDAFPDVLIANDGSNSLSLLRGTGTGGFLPEQFFAIGFTQRAVTLFDATGDGLLDIVVATTIGGRIEVLPGVGGGAYGPKISSVVGVGVYAFAAADLDNDGDLDLVTRDGNFGIVVPLLNNGAGTFAAQGATYSVSGLGSIVTADLNSDGRMDAVAAATGSSAFAVFRGVGNGTFVTPIQLNALSAQPQDVAVADFNADGRFDVASACRASSDVRLRLSTTPLAARIVVQPTGVIAAPGGSASLSVVTSGDPPVSVQWRRNGKNLVNGGAIAGANSPMLTVSPVALANDGVYDAVVSNACQTVTTVPTYIAVNTAPACPGDADGSRAVTFLDITTVLANFGSSCP
jgi:hypothetical protein